MINFFDSGSIEAIASSRRERFLEEAHQYRLARELRVSNGRQNTNRVRRAVGTGLIRAGARISGEVPGDLRHRLATS